MVTYSANAPIVAQLNEKEAIFPILSHNKLGKTWKTLKEVSKIQVFELWT